MKRDVKSLNITKENVKKEANENVGVAKKVISELKSKITKMKESKKNDNEQDINAEIKEKDTISLTDIIKDIKNMTDSDVNQICSFIKETKLRIGIDSNSIKILSENKDNEVLKKLLSTLNQSMNIDVNSISELNLEQLEDVKKLCQVNKIYVNTGWDEGAKVGYSVDKYSKIRSNADKMIQKAVGKLPEDASQKDKFMAIYKAVLKAEKYDYQALNRNNPEYKRKYYTSRNLEGFFIDGTSVCAGTASALQNLCECMGIEAEYVQGYAKSKNGKEELHAWTRIKLGDKWYNVDPTWDANKVGKQFQYCLVSDEDFRGKNNEYHIPDLTYNPTYKRGINEKRYINKTRKYYASTESISREDIKKYYDKDLERKLKIKYSMPAEYTPTEEDYNYFREKQIPIRRH